MARRPTRSFNSFDREIRATPPDRSMHALAWSARIAALLEGAQGRLKPEEVQTLTGAAIHLRYEFVANSAARKAVSA